MKSENIIKCTLCSVAILLFFLAGWHSSYHYARIEQDCQNIQWLTNILYKLRTGSESSGIYRLEVLLDQYAYDLYCQPKSIYWGKHDTERSLKFFSSYRTSAGTNYQGCVYLDVDKMVGSVAEVEEINESRRRMNEIIASIIKLYSPSPNPLNDQTD